MYYYYWFTFFIYWFIHEKRGLLTKYFFLNLNNKYTLNYEKNTGQYGHLFKQAKKISLI